MTNTKQKILNSAINLFNKKGLVNVRLQHIADESDISVGNLAYHFYSKKAIIQFPENSVIPDQSAYEVIEQIS